MLNTSENIQPLTSFRNNPVRMVRQLRETQRSIVLTVNGSAEAVVLDARAYQKLQDPAASVVYVRRRARADGPLSRYHPGAPEPVPRDERVA